jgi:hypothetical protein
VEGRLMNEFGEPNMGNPSVRFDEGREKCWSLAATPLNPASPAYSTESSLLKVKKGAKNGRMAIALACAQRRGVGGPPPLWPDARDQPCYRVGHIAHQAIYPSKSRQIRLKKIWKRPTMSKIDSS